jgi:hypothetical protein
MIKQHSLLIDLTNSSTLTTNNQVTEETVDCVYATLEYFVNWTNSFVTTCLNNYFYYVTTPCSTVDISICIVYSYTVDSPFYLTKLNIELRETTSFRV